MKRRTLTPLVLGVLATFVVSSVLLYSALPSIESREVSMQRDWEHVRMAKIEHAVSETAQKQKIKFFRTKSKPREIFETKYTPSNMNRIRSSVNQLRIPIPTTQKNMRYDVTDCPSNPPEGYPASWNVLQVLSSWNVDNTTIPPVIHQGLCIFDWERDREKAETYRLAEVPFLLQNHPEVLKASERWASPNYLENLIGNLKQRNEYSANNHLMFWRTNHLSKEMIPKGWTNPTENTPLSYKEWSDKADYLDTLSDTTVVKTDHYYFRLNADIMGINTYLYDELPIFSPKQKDSFFMVDPSRARGINCRFGSKGAVAEAHFDASRNWIAVMGGQRRYILGHPKECPNFELYEANHPSGRHSRINWSDPPNRPPFSQLQVSEVLLQAGDALYLPTFWFHFIVSLNRTYQCNARSGTTHENDHWIASCGFQAG